MNKKYLIAGISAVITSVLLSIKSGYAAIVRPAKMRNDNTGSGAFRANRAGGREHLGVDLEVTPGQRVNSPEAATVLRLVYPYRNNTTYKGIDLETEKGTIWRIFYLQPTVKKGDKVSRGQKIGEAQSIKLMYTPDMIDHIHVEKIVNGKHVDPTNDIIL